MIPEYTRLLDASDKIGLRTFRFDDPNTGEKSFITIDCAGETGAMHDDNFKPSERAWMLTAMLNLRGFHIDLNSLPQFLMDLLFDGPAPVESIGGGQQTTLISSYSFYTSVQIKKQIERIKNELTGTN